MIFWKYDQARPQPSWGLVAGPILISDAFWHVQKCHHKCWWLLQSGRTGDAKGRAWAGISQRNQLATDMHRTALCQAMANAQN